MTRWQRILAALLVVQLALSAYVLWPRQREVVAGHPLLGDVQPDAIVALTITDDEGQSLTLRKTDSGWVLADYDDFPADGEKVQEVLEKLTLVSSDNLVTETAASHKPLKVADDDFVRKVEIETEDGQHLTLYFGTAPRFTATNVRLGGEDATYLTTQLATWDLNTTPVSWIDTLFYEAEPGSAQAIDLQNAKGELHFVRSGEQWTLEGYDPAALSAGKVTAFVNHATRIVISAPLGKEEKAEYGMAHPLAVVHVTTKDGDYTITVGAHDEENDTYVVKLSTSPYYVKVAGYNVQDFVNYGAEDFLKTEP